MFYALTKIICRALFGIIFRTKVIGAENIPAGGAFILAANLVSSAVTRKI